MHTDITVAQVNRWAAERIAALSARRGPPPPGRAFPRCLLSAAKRKNGWQLAEQAGRGQP